MFSFQHILLIIDAIGVLIAFVLACACNVTLLVLSKTLNS
jgi:hypothetical protein